MYEFAPGSTGQSVFVLMRDAASGQPKPGLLPTTPGALARYTRKGGTATSFALVALGSAVAPWTSGGIFEVDTGLYRLDVPDAALAPGVGFLAVTLQFNNALGDAALIFLRVSAVLVGAGGIAWTLTVNNSATTLPLAGVSVWATTDAAGTNVVAGTLLSAADGTVLLQLDPGTYFAWTRRPGFTSVPTAFTVAATPGGSGLLMTPATVPPAGPGLVPHQPRLTAFDLLEHLQDYLGADPGEQTFRIAKRAALEGYREIHTAHKWTYLQTQGALFLNSIYNTGTVSYTHTGGTFERMLVLDVDGSGAAWPTWAPLGYVRIGTVNYLVDQRVDGTTLLLDPVINPGQDLAPLTSYTLAQDTYTLPADFVATDNAQTENNWGGLSYVRPQEWFATVSSLESYGQPHYFTIMGDPDVPGRLCLRVFPVPNAVQHLRYLYQRKPRPLTLWDVHAGQASVSAVSSPTTIVVSGGSFTAAMVGCVIRLYADASHFPSDLDGLFPYSLERTITQVVDAQTVRVDTASDVTLTRVAYRLSDPIDVEDLMVNALFRCCEKAQGLTRIMDNTTLAQQAYVTALLLAKGADARVLSRRSAGVAGHYRQRLANMPRGPDIS